MSLLNRGNPEIAGKLLREFFVANYRSIGVGELVFRDFVLDLFEDAMRIIKEENDDALFSWLLDGEGFEQVCSMLDCSEYFKQKIKEHIEKES